MLVITRGYLSWRIWRAAASQHLTDLQASASLHPKSESRLQQYVPLPKAGHLGRLRETGKTLGADD